MEDIVVVNSIVERRDALERQFPKWTQRSLGEWLDHRAELFGDRPLVITDDKITTYGEVAGWSRRLADGLVALGVKPGDHVGIVMANYTEFVPVKFAVAHAGAVAIPLNFLYKAEELAYVLEQSHCTVLITMTGHAGLDYPEMIDSVAPGWDTPEGQTALPLLRHVVQVGVDGRTRDGVRTLQDLEELGRANVGSSAGIVVDPNSVGDILYTSGTTGSPKGVLITHDAVQRTGYASALTRAFDDGWRVLFSLPCYHMFGYIEGLLAAMTVGGAVILQPSFDPAAYLAGIERHQANDILCVPTMTVGILERPDIADYDLSSLQALLSGAAPGPVWLWEKAASLLGITEIVTGYGMTECGGAMTLSDPEDSFELTSSTVGTPKLAGVAGIVERSGALCEYRTADPVTGEFLPNGEEGELISRGPTAMLGFWNKPEETAKGLRDGWVYSGDLGIVRDDGYVQVTGRSKELYKSGGELVMPKEIEELLTAHPGISQVYAIGVPDDKWGEVGCACVVRAPESTITEDEVLALCREHLARFKVPKHVWFLEAAELPTTPTGKIQKFRLVTEAAKLIRQQ
ncbi:class I adenylate-forming enzyme family protein [Rhodococcus sp. YH3-3]|uniref:class I adenylate-forming enzyme family protein n=1 Tax=Rhodococcus sp. YH3-3 TaxID=1803579 RepID=UPI0007DB4C60|nr:AMP-binding protein [Rhodococcus sp. YH3-3]